MNPEPHFTVRPASWADDEEALRELRTRVFIVEQNVPPSDEWDGLDAEALHCMAVARDGTPIGAARLLRSGQIGRLAVVRSWRGRGVGRALLAEMITLARSKGHREPWLHAQLHALPFYARLGFEAVGPEFPEAGIPHRKMILRSA